MSVVREVRESDRYTRIYQKLNNALLIQLNKLVKKIMENPEIGKPMRFGRKGTREVYAGSFRLSYAYDKQLEILYLLDFYHKDEQ